MPTIDKSYFIGLINIAQTDQAEVSDNLDLYILQYKAEFLQQFLGYAFSQLYIAGVEAETPKYLEIQNGVVWTNLHGTQVKYNGLIQVLNEDYKLSPIANYVYWHYMRDQAELSGGIGVVVTTAENATRQSPTRKQVAAWNTMIDMLIPLYDMLLYRKDSEGELVYPDFDKCAVRFPSKQNYLNI